MLRSTLLAAVFALAAATASAADLPAEHPPLPPRAAPVPTHSGTVSEAFPAGAYIYLHVNGDGGDEWIAGPSADIKAGAKVRWNDGSVMTNWQARALNRTLEKVRLVEVLEVVRK